MKTQKAVVLFALGFGLTTLSCQSAGTGTGSTPQGSEASAEVIARVGDHPITLADVDSQIESELKKIEMDRYRARKAKLDEMISEQLVNQKAKALGISTDQLAQQEVTSKVTAPDEAKVKEFYERLQAQGQATSFEEIAPRIRQALSQQAMASRQEEYLASLRKETTVQLSLEPPRIEVSTAGGIEQGPKDAPITMIEFSDFQCPFCSRSQETVAKVLARYEGKIHHVFMDFPLASIHPLAQPAAAAARCAGEQGKYWEYHKALFDRQRDLSPDNFRKWAVDLSLDQEKFDACLAANKYDGVIQQTTEAGQKAGVSGTPGFFINGIMINGAQPFDVFQETIDGELARLGKS